MKQITKIMKKWLVFVLGVVTGFFLAIAIAFILNMKATNSTESINESENNDGITYFKEPGDIIETKSVEVFQVLAEDAALVRCENERGFYHGPICLIVNDEGKYYYDDQIIKIPEGKVARQVGIYQYPTRNEDVKTVPIIEILDK